MLQALRGLMAADPAVHLLTSDTGFHVFDELRREYAARFLNVGIAEAALISVAAGLARAGRQVFVYGIAPFVTMRCFEQIRVDLCYPRLPVKIVGVGAGLTYGPAGPTHHAIEDIAVMSALPNMTVICPGDPVETRRAVEASVALAGPCYLRLGKSGEPRVHPGELPDFAPGRGIRLRCGRGLAVLATGSLLATACEACVRLGAAGLDPELISMHTVKPLDRALLLDAARRCAWVATVEEHSVVGGLGAAVAAVLAEEAPGVRLRRFGVPDCYTDVAGSQEYWRGRYGLTAEQIAGELLRAVRDGGGRP